MASISDVKQGDTSTKFRHIGEGACGSVWAAEGGTMAMKREDGHVGRSLLKDFNMHRLVLQAASQVSVCLPRWPKFVENYDCWWDTNLVRFPDRSTACSVLCSERIPPLPLEVRERLIDRYCPPTAIANIKASDKSRDCLVRLYLGRRRFRVNSRYFSLRNFPLHLDQAEDLELPILKYALAMAEILAVLHWTAKIDANDIEFVLGGVQEQADSARIAYNHGFFGTHSLWVLDFDCCNPLAMNNAGMRKAALAFLNNDPYFPRPNFGTESPDSRLWNEFTTRYLECSHRIITSDSGLCHTLPERFIAQVIEEHERREERKRVQREVELERTD